MFAFSSNQMDRAGLVESVVFTAPNSAHSVWSTNTPTTKILMPTLITIKWKTGKELSFVPELIGKGASRDVLGGVVLGETAQSPWVAKIEKWSCNDFSNSHEYDVANGVLKAFTPKFVGCLEVRYPTYNKERG